MDTGPIVDTSTLNVPIPYRVRGGDGRSLHPSPLPKMELTASPRLTAMQDCSPAPVANLAVA